jgi:hypothetical protein
MGVIQVTAGGRPGAAGRGAGSAAGPDQVLELSAGVVAALCMSVIAGTAGNRDHRSVQGERVAWEAGAGRGAPAWQAGVGGGGAVGVQGGDAPARAGMAGGRSNQVAGVVTV